MTRRRDLSPDEAKLWHRVAKTAKPYKALPAVQSAAPVQIGAAGIVEKQAPDLPHLALKRAKAARVVASVAKPVTAKQTLNPIADASGHKRVRRGKLEIDARLDLHGMRQVEAQQALTNIIARTRADNGRCVLVVTGKGRPVDPGEDFITPQPGVIRRRLPEWLSGAGIREHVSGYAPANARDGGLGAFYVLLKALSTST